MRLIAFPVSLFTVMLLSIVPVSAQTITMSAGITNAGGPVTSCPVTINFEAAITATGWSPTANRQVQYKWIRSDGADAPTQTLDFPASGPSTQTVKTTWQLGANGQNWEAIQISYPPISNTTSNHAVFTLTCPTPGSLVVPRRLVTPILR